MKHLYQIIEQQFISNNLKNIFSSKGDSLNFTTITKKAIVNNQKILASLSNEETRHLANHLSTALQKNICNLNQYFYITQSDKNAFYLIYVTLLQDLGKSPRLKQIENCHYERIRNYLKNSHPKFYKNNYNIKVPQSYVCSEYSANFQIELLEINLNTIREPILDIGCGQHGNLVTALINEHKDAYGIDQMASSKYPFTNSDWFQYNYGIEKWGTIISNLSFSSHFLFHHLDNSDYYIDYCKTYMAILKSLKVGGQWIYAPSIPFVEDFLPKNQYTLTRTAIHDDFLRTTITKTKY